jgi:hypothetical protein
MPTERKTPKADRLRSVINTARKIADQTNRKYLAAEDVANNLADREARRREREEATP